MAFSHLTESLVEINVGNLLDAATKTGIDPAKTSSKRITQKTEYAIGDLIGNKIANKIASAGKSKEDDKTKKVEKIDEKENIIDDMRLF